MKSNRKYPSASATGKHTIRLLAWLRTKKGTIF